MEEWNFAVRLLVAGVLGAVIGLEREYRAKEAGYRTHFLVSLGSALMMIVSKYGFADILADTGVGLDPSRIAAQVVSGIGFIGAGTIIIQRQFVRGLTTAAGVWATAGIGLAVGAGMYSLGVAATILTLVGLEVLSMVFKSVSMRTSLVIFSTADKSVVGRISQSMNPKEYHIVSFQVDEKENRSDVFLVTMVVKTKLRNDDNRLLSFMGGFPEITVEKLE